uniref:Uncharacterized protein n=1 Tax=viral metagenome TaxID=1070528 RepID=A0A6M3MHP2_9ZZZZ
MQTVKYDTSETGWRTILKDYAADLLEKFILEWRLEGKTFEMNSGEAFRYESKQLEEQDRTISRASIIFALNDMVDMGLLAYRDKTGKGGHHRVYSLAMTPLQLEVYVVTNILQRVRDTWPDVYQKVVEVVQ